MRTSLPRVVNVRGAQERSDTKDSAPKDDGIRGKIGIDQLRVKKVQRQLPVRSIGDFQGDALY